MDEASIPTRERLLRAAARVILRDGYSALTLDAVAAESKLSKGGLLYHFRSKDELIGGLVDLFTRDFERAHAAALAGEAATPGRWTRAYVRATLTDGDADPSAGLVAAVAHRPELLDELKRRYVAWNAALADDALPGVDAQVVRFAVDGLWLCGLLGLGAPSAQQRRRITRRLLELAGGRP